MPAPAASAAVVESPSRALLGSAPGQKEPVWRAAKPPAAGDAGVPPGKAASVPSEPTAAVPSGHVGAVWRNPIPSGSSTSSLEASSGDNPSSSSVADALEQFAVADSDPGQGEEKKISSAEDGAMASSSKKSPAGKSGMKTSTEKKPAMKAVMKKAAAKVSPKPSAKGSPKKGASAASQKRPRSPAKDDGAASPAAKRAKTDKAPAMKKAAKIPALYQEWHDAKTCIPWPGDHNKVQKGAGNFDGLAWNVAGLRAFLSGTKTSESRAPQMRELLAKKKPDVLFLLETKLQEEHEADVRATLAEVAPAYDVFFNSCTAQKGYSGLACLTLKTASHKPVSAPVPVVEGFFEKGKEEEGRLFRVEYAKFVAICVYTPNSGAELQRLGWRIATWDRDFRRFVAKQKKPVVALGDFNAAHLDADIWNQNISKAVEKNAGTTPEERASFGKLLEECDLVDVLRRDVGTEGLGYFTYWAIFRGRKLIVLVAPRVQGRYLDAPDAPEKRAGREGEAPGELLGGAGPLWMLPRERWTPLDSSAGALDPFGFSPP
eukprot:gene293-248_t